MSGTKFKIDGKEWLPTAYLRFRVTASGKRILQQLLREVIPGSDYSPEGAQTMWVDVPEVASPAVPDA